MDLEHYKFPKTIAATVDKYYTVRQERLKADKIAGELKKEEELLKEQLINTIPKSEATGVAGKLARATVVTKIKPQVEDWDKVYSYVKKKNRFDLLQKRLSDAAIEELWEAGVTVPGVKTFNHVTISLNKV